MLKSILALAVLSLLASSLFASPQLVSLDGKLIPAHSPALYLFVHDKDELRDAFTIVTALADSWQEGHCYVILQLPSSNPLKTLSLKKAARGFFKSEASRNSIALLDEKIDWPDSAPEKIRSALLDNEAQWQWIMEEYPNVDILESLLDN